MNISYISNEVPVLLKDQLSTICRKISCVGLCPWLFVSRCSYPGFKKEKSHGSCPVPVWRPFCVFILTAAGTLISERSSFNLLETEAQKSQGAGHNWVTRVSPAPWSAGHFPVLLIFLSILLAPSPPPLLYPSPPPKKAPL